MIDKKTRDKTTKKLAVFLSAPSRNGLTHAEMAKLWKGIFYCAYDPQPACRLWSRIKYAIECGSPGFWMSDKPLVQPALASELAEIMLNITSTPFSLDFLQGFWEATVREWSGIDRLRSVSPRTSFASTALIYDSIDKYYMLIRRFVNASFRLLMRDKWERDSCQRYNAILTQRGGPLW